MPAVCVVSILLASLLPAGDAVPQSSAAQAVADFQERVGQYIKLRKEAVKQVPDLKKKADAASVVAHEQQLATAIRTARPSAKPGDIITPAAQKHFRQITMREIQGAEGTPVKDTIKQGNPPKESEGAEVRLQINGAYPKAAPKSSMPASLLQRFPALPEELEYRFVGRALIVRDTVANIIVDYAPGIGPAL